ncbi:serine/threonine-protein kinase CG17528-like [Teleopsis dalmanni]|uniref:serine/threonine-protein kinase CG17528-like n=1 Tax=Teleopsis dalmanni TaxID=139649 RepID=UPI0018CD2165|nr:serine/threonine-protein kinase CG17528-like [Teleopsis dalmanni]
MGENAVKEPVIKLDRHGRSLWKSRFLYVNKLKKKLMEEKKADGSFLERGTSLMNKVIESSFSYPSCSALIQAEKNKAQRIKFKRYGDKFFPGIIIPVSVGRYKTFDKLCEDITRFFAEKIKLPGPIRNIYNEYGNRITMVAELSTSECYMCCCNNEVFSKMKPKKNCMKLSTDYVIDQTPIQYGEVFTRTILLIQNGPRPRKIKKLLLNKRNSANFDCVLKAINNVTNLTSGCVRKVFTLCGYAVLELTDFFGEEDIFLVCGKERFDQSKDFELAPREKGMIANIFAKDWKIGKTYRVKPIVPPEENVYEELKNSLPPNIRDNYDLNGKLGKGTYGMVMQVIDRKTDIPYALKIIDKTDDEDIDIDVEVQMLRNLSHPHIVSLLQVIDTENKKYILLEYVGDSTLFWLLRDENHLSEEKTRLVMRQLASVLVYLHELNIIHRDIKPENILVDKEKHNNINIKLCDFGLAAEVNETLYFKCGTKMYMAPEIMSEVGYGLKADVWSCGVTLCRMLTGDTPFEKRSTSDCLTDISIDKINYPELFENNITQDCKDLIKKMLMVDADMRINSKQILEHSWIKYKRISRLRRSLHKC